MTGLLQATPATMIHPDSMLIAPVGVGLNNLRDSEASGHAGRRESVQLHAVDAERRTTGLERRTTGLET